MELFILVIICFAMASGLNINDTCTTPCNKPGICVPIKSCEYASNLSQNGNYKDAQYLISSKCGMLSGPRPKPLTCCPKLLNPENCGAVSTGNRIFGGEPTKLEEHPWAALLFYNLSRKDTPGFRLAPNCGGSLINSRHVLTAAHCVDGPRSLKLTYVRLGEYNTSSPEECTTVNNEEICRQDVGIDKVIVHSGYDMQGRNVVNDIALVRLSSDVEFSKFVKPICMPFDETIRNMPIEGEELTVTGWGKTEEDNRSEIQLHVELIGKNHNVCNQKYSTANITLADTQLCVGGEPGKDSCKGDSGGPLMRQELGVWYQVGVVSFGHKFCGYGGFPGIYTDVSKYLNWIEQTVNESHCD